MAKIEITQTSLVVHMEGADKLWALKSRLEVPLAHVASAGHASDASKAWHGFRTPGTDIPGVISAGTFHQDGERVFWHVHHADHAIEIALHDERYARLVIEVDEPDAAVAAIEAALTGAEKG